MSLLRMSGNSFLCPTGHWPFEAANLHSLHFFSWSLSSRALDTCYLIIAWMCHSVISTLFDQMPTDNSRCFWPPKWSKLPYLRFCRQRPQRGQSPVERRRTFVCPFISSFIFASPHQASGPKPNLPSCAIRHPRSKTGPLRPLMPHISLLSPQAILCSI